MQKNSLKSYTMMAKSLYFWQNKVETVWKATVLLDIHHCFNCRKETTEHNCLLNKLKCFLQTTKRSISSLHTGTTCVSPVVWKLKWGFYFYFIRLEISKTYEKLGPCTDQRPPPLLYRTSRFIEIQNFYKWGCHIDCSCFFGNCVSFSCHSCLFGINLCSFVCLGSVCVYLWPLNRHFVIFLWPFFNIFFKVVIFCISFCVNLVSISGHHMSPFDHFSHLCGHCGCKVSLFANFLSCLDCFASLVGSKY